MRWVTFYYDLIRKQVSALEVHENKEVALKHFKTNYKNYFQLNTSFKLDKLPATYGYPMRKYYGISATAFKKMFGVSVDEALKQAESEDKE
jgi:hypothetical protein